MSTAKILVDKWIKSRSFPTLDAAAKVLGKAKGTTISNWRTGYAKPDDESIAIMCEQCGEDAAQWIGRLHLEFEQSPRLKKVWLRLAQTAAVIALTIGMDVHTAKAESISGSHANFTITEHLYIMRTKGWSDRGPSSPSSRVHT